MTVVAGDAGGWRTRPPPADAVFDQRPVPAAVERASDRPDIVRGGQLPTHPPQRRRTPRAARQPHESRPPPPAPAPRRGSQWRDPRLPRTTAAPPRPGHPQAHRRRHPVITEAPPGTSGQVASHLLSLGPL